MSLSAAFYLPIAQLEEAVTSRHKEMRNTLFQIGQTNVSTEVFMYEYVKVVVQCTYKHIYTYFFLCMPAAVCLQEKRIAIRDNK